MLTRLQTQLIHNGPRYLRIPLQLTPFPLKRQLLKRLLNWQFTQALQQGELDFLQGKWLGVDVRDLGLRWTITLQDNQLQVMDRCYADVWFRGDANDLLLIAAHKQDPDTLFFQRRLLIEGDTELGLEAKNMMDALDLQEMPAPLRIAMIKLASMVETGLKKETHTSGSTPETSC
ncbi:MAG: hypothetical protein XXXJIFNMEKO3_00140 [Candidatus Erwinia impunctatus]